MQIQRRCKQCGTPLGADKKLGAKYCNHSCQQGYYKRRKIIQDKIKKLERELEFNRNWIEENNAKAEVLATNKIDMSEIERKLKSLKKALSTLNILLNASASEFRKHLHNYLEQKSDQFEDDYDYLRFGEEFEKNEILSKHRSRFQKLKQHTIDEIESFQKVLTEHKTTNEKTAMEILGLNLKNLDIESDIEKIEVELAELNAIDLENLPIKINPKKQETKNSKIKQQAKGVSGEQVLKMKFNNIELAGALGEFLGLIQRNKCAIALTGDSGAGKTTFSFKLAKSFIDASQKVGYFSLESGITETTQEIIEELNLTSSKFEVFGEGDLEDVRLRATNFDCIIVDSYAKISTKAEDFENLRQDFPNTFFIILFQKTTDGKIRGGSSILFNSTATIDIRLTKGNHRIAFMQKSRYGTENFVYSISLDTVLKNDKTPIKWSEIEENWPSPDYH